MIKGSVHINGPIWVRKCVLQIDAVAGAAPMKFSNRLAVIEKTVSPGDLGRCLLSHLVAFVKIPVAQLNNTGIFDPYFLNMISWAPLSSPEK